MAYREILICRDRAVQLAWMSRRVFARVARHALTSQQRVAHVRVIYLGVAYMVQGHRTLAHAHVFPFLATRSIEWRTKGGPNTKSGANHILKAKRSAGRFIFYRIGLWT
jgi:hypothetical protein